VARGAAPSFKPPDRRSDSAGASRKLRSCAEILHFAPLPNLPRYYWFCHPNTPHIHLPLWSKPGRERRSVCVGILGCLGIAHLIDFVYNRLGICKRYHQASTKGQLNAVVWNVLRIRAIPPSHYSHHQFYILHRLQFILLLICSSNSESPTKARLEAYLHLYLAKMSTRGKSCACITLSWAVSLQW
jgi:hypothetical protein